MHRQLVPRFVKAFFEAYTLTLHTLSYFFQLKMSHAFKIDLGM